MTQSVIITIIVAIIMYFLAYKDHKTFKSGQHINYKHVIVSIGVLGTFVGIVWGLWNFNTQNIGASVPQLLEGLKLAFLTSILGMVVSIFLSILQSKPEVKTNIILLEIKQQLEELNKISLNSLSELRLFTNVIKE